MPSGGAALRLGGAAKAALFHSSLNRAARGRRSNSLTGQETVSMDDEGLDAPVVRSPSMKQAKGRALRRCVSMPILEVEGASLLSETDRSAALAAQKRGRDDTAPTTTKESTSIKKGKDPVDTRQPLELSTASSARHTQDEKCPSIPAKICMLVL